MSKIRSTQLKEGDIVVAEASVIRWSASTKDGKEGKDANDENSKDGQRRDIREKRTRKKVWDNWRAEFKLESLWWTYPGSKHRVTGQGPPDDVEL